MKFLALAVWILLIAGSGAASAQTVAKSALLRSDPAVPAGTLATISGRPITIDSLEPRLAEAIARLDEMERAERKRAFEEVLSLELFAMEGRARRISAQEVIAAEMRLRAKPPTPAEINKVYQEHLADFGGAELAKVRPQIVAYLQEKQTNGILTAFAQRLRAKYPVTLSNDINQSNIAPNTVLAVIAGKPMLAGPLLERLKPSIFDIRNQVYTAARQALDQLIYSRLVIDEASRRNVGSETIIRSEISEKEPPVTDADVERYFNDNKKVFEQNKYTLDMARNAIFQQLQEQNRKRLEDDLAARLKKQHPVVDYLVAPEVPVLTVSVDDDPSRGDANAPVTVVMFTDFQCTACARTHPILQELLKPYGNRVRFVVRDFPLPMHPDSRIAAEAAGAANAQGKFFQYIELLYSHQDALSLADLKKYATEVGLDRVKFDLAMTRGTYKGEIVHDIEEGGKYGVTSTPAIFVNGRKIVDLSPGAIQQVLDKAFGAGGSSAGKQ